MTPRCLEFIAQDCNTVLTPERTEQLKGLRNSTLAITGGTGFLGSWLLEIISVLNETKNFGVEVVVQARNIDTFKKRRPHLASKPFVRFSKTDITYECDLPRNTKWVIHAAANRDRRHHSSFPVQTMNLIAQGTDRMLRALESCADLQMAANLSSGLVYGNQPLDMDRIPVGFSGVVPLDSALSSYAEAKRYAELLCTSFRVERRLPVMNIRPFSFIGPYQTLESPWAVTSFIQDALRGRPIRVLGNGKTTRTYMYPTDAAFWILRLLTAGESGRSFNLGSPEALTLESLAGSVASHFSPRPEILYSAGPKDASVSRLVPDVNNCVEEFGLQVTVPFEQALSRTLQWFRLSGEE